jgi:2-C-methyl-D-erythritol 4-phosphate cytidylyltransferase
MGTQRTCWTVIPAAGLGTRMGTGIPKQYMPLAGKTVLEHTLQRFTGIDTIKGLVVVLAADDHYWQSLQITSNTLIHTTIGAAERYQSVLNGLRYLEKMADADDWVLVHDAARPCVRPADIKKLINATSLCVDGAILAVPVRDTMKRADAGNRITATVSRDQLWHAQTPQIFQLGTLRAALEKVVGQNMAVTDEAQAIEMTGLCPLMVEGHPDNIKITHPADLSLAEIYLRQQETQL